MRVQIISAFLADHVAVYDGKLNVLGGVWASYATAEMPHTADAPLALVVQVTHEDAGRSGIAPDVWLPLSRAEQKEIHLFLAGYSPPEDARAALRAWEEREGVHLIEEPPPDRQLDAALALLSDAPLELRGDPLE